jgi:thioredoxin-dependent peroxiredoxin
MSKEPSHRLHPGHKAPDFTAEAIGGEYGDTPTTIRLSDFRGQPVVLYFYPKDDTPGCTTQACELRDKWHRFHECGAKIFGVSVDSIESHRKFIEKQELPFALLSDPEKTIVQAYDVWVEKSMYGKKYMGTERSTFVIRPDGTIKAVFRKVKPSEHAGVLADELL